MRRAKPKPLQAELEAAKQRVLEEYEQFLAAGPLPGEAEDARAFAARHAAARAALAHLEQLLKLAGPGENQTLEEAAQLIAEARTALAQEGVDDSG